ncbi:MAG: hypothetical protein F4W68_06810 [Cenarchaeum sp. SB0661_bin_35]|nr:hypothetical protein [Cenarchaeum sp. SB0667_bin_13]MYC80188.1 hypothetical protein [Cenarchaeum sp. SB0661_bin_35]MYI51210.1 hypothetical protein [Cenarchaeum sp. SB0673_bin_9]
MEPFFLICLQCHNARTWHHRSENMRCPNGCDIRCSMPWNRGFGPDVKPVPRHDSALYGDGIDEWPDTDTPAFHIHNISEMKQKCQ